MRALSLAETEALEQLQNALEEKKLEIEGALGDLAVHCAAKYGEDIQPLVAQYNQLIDKTNAFIEGVRERIDEYMAERSDAWRESEKGEAYERWYESWDESCEELTVDEPNVDEDVDDSAIELLRELPHEPSVD